MASIPPISYIFYLFVENFGIFSIFLILWLAHVYIDLRLSKHYSYDTKKDPQTEATTQTDVKHYRNVNVSTQIICDQNDRYLDPYYRTYDQQTEAMVQTEYGAKDILIGGDTPLHTSRGAPKIISLDQFPQTQEPQLNNQICHMNENYSQPMPYKRTFKLDLSSVCADEDSFELGDDDEAFTDEDNNSSLFHGKR
jgi:hypothetical protein